jgi:ABC-type Zn uptake system ZnuABC Zn-binding protein ZnuA
MLLVCWLASSVFTSPAAAQSPKKLQVVSSFSVLDDMVRNVGGDAISATSIVPAGGDAHNFDPKPDQVASISSADLIFEIGLGLEPWLPDMISASGTSGKTITLSDGLNVIEIADEGEDQEQDAGDHGHEHDHGGTDPHVWGDVQNAIAIVAAIKDALISADPDNASTYEANAASYTSQLQNLDTFIKDEVAKLPEDRRKLVTSHDTFGYFARAYGFEIVGTALGSVSTEAGDPSAKDIAALIGEIRNAGVPAIFTENVSNPDLIESIAAEAGVEVGPPLYTDALGESGSDGDTYIKMMTWNATSIVTALAG